MESGNLLPFVANVELRRDGRVWQAFEARCATDLRVRVEMLTGIAWLQLMPRYQQLWEKGGDELHSVERVCLSYEKWGDWQQECIEIEVRMVRMFAENEDLRAEWYREYDPYAASLPRIPRLYWLGMAASAIWLVAYLLICPSTPLPGGHWRGLGVSGGCQPWTAICEMQQGEAELDAVRGGLMARIRDLPVEEVVADVELKEFIARAGRVRYADQCGGCHGNHGLDPARVPFASLPEGKDVTALLVGLRHVHDFGLARHLDEPDAKLLAAYVWMMDSAGRP